MRILFQAFALCALILVGPVCAAGLDAPYTPTRAEWLKQSVSSGISEQFNAWARRLAVSVVVFSDRNEVIVTLTEANPLRQNSCRLKF